jgi:phospholipid/cholesterol/gamma-HCH transport system substrate-binding protein
VITRTVRIQLMVFLLITVVGVAFVGAKYAQIDKLVVDTDYTVSASFVESGGIFAGAEVTYRGQPVGRVGQLKLLDDGVQVDMDIEKKFKIPNDLLAVVANRSAIGEQYVDLQPRRDGAPYLQDNSKIDRKDTAIPIDTTELLLNLDQLVNSVDKESLRTTVRELGAALKGKGTDLQKIIDSSGKLIDDADANVLQTIKLINDGDTVLATQVASGDAIKTWAKNLALLSDTLVSSDSNLRKVIDQGSLASTQITGLIQDNSASIAVLLGNLLTVSELTAVRLDAVEQLFVVYPAVSMGGYVVPAKNAEGHYDAHFGLGSAGRQGHPCEHQGRLYGGPVERDQRPRLAEQAVAVDAGGPEPVRVRARVRPDYGRGGRSRWDAGYDARLHRRTAGPARQRLLEGTHPWTGDRQVIARNGRLVLAWALSVLLLVAIAGLTLSVVALSKQRADDSQRDGAMKAARQLALDFTTYDYQTWDADSKRVIDDSTGQFKQEFQQGIDAVKTDVVTNKATSKGDVKEAAVVSNDKDSAQVLVIVNAVVTNTASAEGVERRYRIKLDMVREKDRWLTADLQVVG